MSAKIIYHNSNCIVFNPSLSGDSSKISKVLDYESFVPEKRGIDLIELVDPKHDYTVKSTYYKVKKTYFVGTTEIKENNYIIEQTKMGTSLRDIKLSTDNYKEIMYSLIRVFDFILLMIKKNVIHTDLKLGNIVHDGSKSYIIDYGLVSKFDKIEFYCDSIYPYFSVEVYLSNTSDYYHKHYIYSVDEYTQRYRTSSYFKHITKKCNKLFSVDLLYIFDNQMSDFEKQLDHNELQKLLKKTDLFSFSFSLLELAIDISEFDNEFSIKLVLFLLGERLLCFNPIIRIDTETALIKFTNFLIENL